MVKKITNIDKVFDYLEKIDYLGQGIYMITDYSYDSKNIKVKLESRYEKKSITFVFKEIIENEFNVQCTNADGFELFELLFFEDKEGVFISDFNELFTQRIFIKFKQIELIIENVSSCTIC